MPDPEVVYGAEVRPEVGKTRIYADVDHLAIQAAGARFKVAIMEQAAHKVAEVMIAQIVEAHREEILKEITPQRIAEVIVQKLATMALDQLKERR